MKNIKNIYIFIILTIPSILYSGTEAPQLQKIKNAVRPMTGTEILQFRVEELKREGYFPSEVQNALEETVKELKNQDPKNSPNNTQATQTGDALFQKRNTTRGREDWDWIMAGVATGSAQDAVHRLALFKLLNLLNRLTLGHGLNTDEVTLELLEILEREVERLGLRPKPGTGGTQPSDGGEGEGPSTPNGSTAVEVLPKDSDMRQMMYAAGFQWTPYAEPPYRAGKEGTLFTPSSYGDPKNAVVLGDCEGKTLILQSFIEINGDPRSGALFKIHDEKPASGAPCAPFIFTSKEGTRKERWVSMPSANHMFVFMGDAPDHGPDSLNFLRFLVELKKAYPQKVVLLLGNRDINKLRFLAEFGPGRENINTRPFPLLWQGMPFEEAVKKTTADGKNYLYEDIGGLPINQTGSPLPKFNWVLDQTMGARTAFSSRQKELQAILGPKVDVNNMRVFDSLTRTDLAAGTQQDIPDGLMRQYLLLADMFHLHKPSGTLFVHGHVGKSNLLVYPKGYNRNPIVYSKAGNISIWLKELNAWAHEGIKKALNAQRVDSSDIESLIAYVEPLNSEERDANKAPLTLSQSIIQNRYCGGTNNPSLASLDTQTILTIKKAGIQRIVVGHTPYGGVPIVMREPAQTSEGKPFEVCAVDNSFAGTLFDKENPSFGSYVSLDSDEVRVFGRIKIAEAFLDISANTRDPLVGHVFEPDVANVVAAMPSKDYLLYIKRGFSSLYYTLTQKTLEACIHGQIDIQNLVEWLIKKYEKKSALSAQAIEGEYLSGQESATEPTPKPEQPRSYFGTELAQGRIRVVEVIGQEHSGKERYALRISNPRYTGPQSKLDQYFRVVVSPEDLKDYISEKRDVEKLIQFVTDFILNPIGKTRPASSKTTNIENKD